MANATIGMFLRHWSVTAGAQRWACRSDGELLEAYSKRHEEAAFAELMRRHGPLVLGVCRRVLSNTQDAEDSFQATFALLACKAATIRRQEPLDGWLYRVACRTALNARRGRSRRVRHESQAKMTVAVEPSDEWSWAEMRPILDEEIERLPALLRQLIIGRHLQGKTLAQLAADLGLPPGGSVPHHLEKAYELLRRRLIHRGVVLSAVLMTKLLTERVATAHVPARLMVCAATVARASAAGAMDAVPSAVARLTRGTLTLLSPGTMRLGLLLACSVAVLAGAGLLAVSAPRNKTESAAAISDRDNDFLPEREKDPLPEHALVRLGTTHWRSAAPVQLLSFTPDGKHLFTVEERAGSTEPALQFWNPATGRGVRSLGRGIDHPRETLFSPDGKMLLIYCENRGTIRLWDVAADRELQHWESVKFPAAFAPDGRKVLLTRVVFPENRKLSYNLEIYETATGKELCRLTGPPLSEQPHASLAAAFDARGQTAIVADRDGRVRWWDIAEKKEVGSFPFTPPDGLSRDAVRLSADGRILAVYHVAANDFSSWDVRTGRRLAHWPANIRPFRGQKSDFALALSRDGRTLAATLLESSAGPTVSSLWDTSTGKKLAFQRVSGVWCAGLALSPDGKMLAGLHNDRKALNMWEAASNRERPEPGHWDPPALAAALNGATVLTWAPADGTLRSWDRRTGRETQRLAISVGTWLSPTAVSHNGRTFVVAEPNEKHEESRLRLWDRLSGKEMRSILVPGQLVTTVALSDDGQRVAATLANKWKSRLVQDIATWDVTTGKRLATYHRAEDPNRFECQGIVFSADGRRLLSWFYVRQDQRDRHTELRWTSANEGALLHTLSLPAVRVLAVSRDGTLLACAPHPARYHPQALISIYDLATGSRLAELPAASPGGYNPACFSGDGTILATGDEKGTIQLWESATGKELGCLRGQGGKITTLAFAPDGQLLSGSADTTVLVWDVRGMLPRGTTTPPRSRALKGWWLELGEEDLVAVHRALRSLQSCPSRSVTFLRDRLLATAAAEPDARLLARLLADLDSDMFAVRERATRELMALGEQAVPALRRALLDTSSLEVRTRLKALLKPRTPVARGDEARRRRALFALESIGTLEARTALRQLAEELRGTPLEAEARACFQRLAQYRGSTP